MELIPNPTDYFFLISFYFLYTRLESLKLSSHLQRFYHCMPSTVVPWSLHHCHSNDVYQWVVIITSKIVFFFFADWAFVIIIYQCLYASTMQIHLYKHCWTHPHPVARTWKRLEKTNNLWLLRRCGSLYVWLKTTTKLTPSEMFGLVTEPWYRPANTPSVGVWRFH